MNNEQRKEHAAEAVTLLRDFPEAFKMLTEFDFKLTLCQYPGGFCLHGKVVSDNTVFRKIVEVQSSGSLFPLIPNIVINAVIVDTAGEPSIPVDCSVVFSAELNLGESNNLYLEHMQRYKEVDPMAIERLFVAAALLMMKNH